jgi:hypothetical protein
MDLEALLKKAQWGKISHSDLAAVVRILTSGDQEHLLTLLNILGRAGSPRYKYLMERYLNYENDPQISALSLKALCRWWGLFKEYRHRVISFLQGVEWDIDQDVKLQAIGLAGEYLRDHSDLEILESLHDIFVDQRERNLIRGAAYLALCRSDGAEWADLPPASRPVDLSTEVDQAVVSRIEQKLRDHLM